MEATLRDDRIVAGGDARQRFYDARGYGYPLGGNEIALSRVEAAHLLFRGDLNAVRIGGEGLGFKRFLERVDDTRFGALFLVYLDLRQRGFYLSPARSEWVDDPASNADFVVYKRGSGPEDGAVAHQIRVVGEREPLDPPALGECVLSVVDEESEVTYFAPERTDPKGTTDAAIGAETVPEATLLTDRVICWDPPAGLYESAFYGHPLGSRDDAAASDALQLSLLEAAQLVAAGRLRIPGGYDAVVERGRAVEGDHFDRRLQVYAALRERGIVPKTGFKFGADFRTYDAIDSVENLGHSNRLIRVLAPSTSVVPRDLSLDVRLAHGVRKDLVYAWPADDGVEFLAVSRLTP
ncbi:MAG: tRNA-intron lyase [Salinarchaeum sp.]